MYKLIGPNYNRKFETRAQLVGYIAQSNWFLGTELRNNILDDIAVNKGDTKRVFPSNYIKDHSELVERTTFVLDDNDNSLYCKAFIEEVRNCKIKKDCKRYNPYTYKNGRFYKYSYYRKQPSSFEFRKDPVPGTGKAFGYNRTRNVKIHQKLKQATNPEYKEYNRYKTINDLYEFTWDKPFRQRMKNWKSQSKKKFQWM